MNLKQLYAGKKIVFVIVLAIALGAFAVWKLHSATPATPPANRAALTQLQKDMESFTPHFIKANANNGQILTPEEQKITDDIIALFVASNPDNSIDYYSRLWLDAVGTRYVLITQPSAGSSFDEIVDSQTGAVTQIPGDMIFYLVFEGGRNTALYIADQDIYTYTLDQSSFVSVPNAKLSGTETYQSGKWDGPAGTEEQTHTDTSVTISIFDTSKRIPNPALGPGATMNGKVGQKTLSF